MYLTLVFLPFIGALTVAVRGRSLGFAGASIVTTGCILLGASLAWFSVYEVVLCRSPVTVTVMDWLVLSPEGLNLRWTFVFDDLSLIMCAVVLTVSGLVHVFSVDYIAGDPHGQRFISLLSLFTAFMILLVTGDNLAIMFAGGDPSRLFWA